MQLSFEKKGNTEDDKHVGKHAWTPGGGGRGVKLSFGHGFKDEGVTLVELFLDYTVKLNPTERPKLTANQALYVPKCIQM